MGGLGHSIFKLKIPHTGMDAAEIFAWGQTQEMLPMPTKRPPHGKKSPNIEKKAPIQKKQQKGPLRK